jgi:hypothetical protein
VAYGINRILGHWMNWGKQIIMSGMQTAKLLGMFKLLHEDKLSWRLLSTIIPTGRRIKNTSSTIQIPANDHKLN